MKTNKNKRPRTAPCETPTFCSFVIRAETIDRHKWRSIQTSTIFIKLLCDHACVLKFWHT